MEDLPVLSKENYHKQEFFWTAHCLRLKYAQNMQSLKQQGSVKKPHFYTSLSSPLLFSLILLFAPLDLL